MLPRLPYRIQIPLGLALTVILSVLLVSVVAAQISARSARAEIISTVQRVMELLVAQGRPLVIAEDTWRAFTLLKNTAALLPDAQKGLARAAILDAEGRLMAGSDPVRLPTGEQALGRTLQGRLLPTVSALTTTQTISALNGSLSMVRPIRSEDERIIGFVLVEIDADAFAPDWTVLGGPALIGAALAVIGLVPLGWLAGRRMARPIAQTAECIAQIGRTDLKQLQLQVPTVHDPELNRIAGAVRSLLAEMATRQANQQRALSAERLAAVGRITAVVAHEINNPLAGLITATQTLRLHGDAPQTRQRSLDLIERGLLQIRTMTAALLPQARVEDRHLRLEDLDDVLTLVQTTAEQQLVTLTCARNVSFDMRVPSTVCRQVMLNLVLNAIKAAGRGGQVQAALDSDASEVRFSVANSGQRMTDALLQQRLLAENGNDPHGFGLWICQEFAVRYGGYFGSAAASDIAPPFTTRLIFGLPNQPHHDHEQINAA